MGGGTLFMVKSINRADWLVATNSLMHSLHYSGVPNIQGTTGKYPCYLLAPNDTIWQNRSGQELITPRNSHVTGAQVPTCLKFTADKLDSYSKIVFVLCQIWCKIYSCN